MLGFPNPNLTFQALQLTGCLLKILKEGDCAKIPSPKYILHMTVSFLGDQIHKYALLLVSNITQDVFPLSLEQRGKGVLSKFPLFPWRTLSSVVSYLKAWILKERDFFGTSVMILLLLLVSVGGGLSQHKGVILKMSWLWSYSPSIR